MTYINKTTMSHASTAIAVLITLLVATTGCSEGPSTNSAGHDKANEEFLAALPNVELIEDAASSGIAELEDGYFEEPAAPGSATKTIIRLDQKSVGDLNADGTDDAAVIVIVDSGGSGTFYHLGIVLNNAGVARHIGSTFLGDRISIKSLGISDGVVTVTSLERNSTESMAAKPSVEKTKSFTVRNGNIEEAT